MNEIKESGNTTTTTSTTGDTKVLMYGRHQATPRPTKKIPKPKFLINQANIGFAEVAQGMTTQKYIFGGLISEGDLTILFSQANIGKSFIAWQTGEAKASGKNVFSVMDNVSIINHGEKKYYNLNNTSEPETVLIFDFESTREKNKGRYTNNYNNNEYQFNKKLIICYPDYGSEASDFDDPNAIIAVIAEKIKETNAKFVIIDNITSLAEDNADGKKALILMKKLKWLQIKNKITLLVIAHTTKIYSGKPVIWQDMAGSYVVFSLADNVFAINNGTDDKGSYLIQMKAKYSEKYFEKDNVIAMKKISRSDGFVGFEFIDYTTENSLIKPVDDDKNAEEKEIIIRHIKATKLLDTPPKTLKEIAKELHEKYGKDVPFETYYSRIKKRSQRGDYDGKNNESEEVAKKVEIPTKVEILEVLENISEIPTKVEKVEILEVLENISEIPTKVEKVEILDIIPANIEYTEKIIDDYSDIAPY